MIEIEYIDSIGTESYSVSIKHSLRLNGEFFNYRSESTVLLPQGQ